VSATRSTRLVVLGAGPHGLAVALGAVEAGLEPGRDLVVVDPSGAWLTRWRHQFAAYGIDALRSPGVHHPDADPGALAQWAQAHDRRSEAAYGQPWADAFEGFCEDLVRDRGLDGTVCGREAVLLSATGAGVVALLDDGTTIEAERGVLATNPGRRRIPTWVGDLLPAPPRSVQHAADVDLRACDVEGQRVVVVGGGLTAAHLAVGAIERGARAVDLVLRRDQRISTFDTDPGWLGPKELDGFATLAPAARADAVLAARDGGSIPGSMASALRRRIRDGALEVHERTRVVAGQQRDGGLELVLGDEARLGADRIWLATGTVATVDACRLLDDVAVAHPTPVHRGFPELSEDLRWPGTTLHVTGRLASLQLGPAAGNLWGARKAAERVLSSVGASALSTGQT
jgi:hypothetical protein